MIISIIAILISLVASALMWVYGSKLKNGVEIADKPNAGKTMIGFGVMNVVFALILMIIILTGCKNYRVAVERE